MPWKSFVFQFQSRTDDPMMVGDERWLMIKWLMIDWWWLIRLRRFNIQPHIQSPLSTWYLQLSSLTLAITHFFWKFQNVFDQTSNWWMNDRQLIDDVCWRLLVYWSSSFVDTQQIILKLGSPSLLICIPFGDCSIWASKKSIHLKLWSIVVPYIQTRTEKPIA